MQLGEIEMKMVECTVCNKKYAHQDSLRKHMKSQHSAQSMALRIYNRNDADVEQLNRYLDTNKSQLEPSTWKSLKQKINGSKPKIIAKSQNGLLRIKAKQSQNNPLIATGIKRKSIAQGGSVKRPDKRSDRAQTDDLNYPLIPTGTKRKSSKQGGLVKRTDRNDKNHVLRGVTGVTGVSGEEAQNLLIPTGTKRMLIGQGGLVKRSDRNEKENVFQGVNYPKSLWFHCDLCEKSFNDNQQLADHLVQQHPSCPKCQEHFVDMKTYEEHWREYHLEHQCFMCKNKFHDQNHLNEHLKIHPRCVECDQMFLNDQQLQQHWNENHLEAIETMPKEEITDEEMSEDEQLEDQSDVESETQNDWEDGPDGEQEPYQGDYQTPGPSNLDKYDEDDPPKDNLPPKYYQCEICRKNFKLQSVLDLHMKTHGTTFSCKTCRAVFQSNRLLEEHVDLDHPRCKVCKKRFTTQARYLNHLTEHNKKYEPFEEELPLDSEDEVSDAEDPRAEMKREDRQFQKHINCVTIDRFLEIRKLIDQNKFETIANDEELLEGLQIIMKGVIKGFIPICSAQRFVMSKEMKMLMYRFVKSPSSTILLRNKQNLKMLFNLLWSSVKTVIETFVKYDQLV